MCDTLLAPPMATAERIMMFAKNSDRQRNEAQLIQKLSAADYARGESLSCTYINIPQVTHTFATLLCRPFWTWGAEMGANEHGVVIGNEGLHARRPAPKEPALIGMDLVRLGLERGQSAEHAVDVIIELLEQYGQGGNCGHRTPSYYNNGFIVADRSEAFVLETIERQWVVEKINGVRTISNRYTIGREVQRASAGLLSLVQQAGWSIDSVPHYADAISDPSREHIGHATARRARSSHLLRRNEGRITARRMMAILRDHGADASKGRSWRADCSTPTLCMHAGGAERPGQTVGSLVSELHLHDQVHWVTGTSAPCLSIFKPVLMDVPLPIQGPPPTDVFDRQSLWWQHELLHRAALLADLSLTAEVIQKERDALERRFVQQIRAVLATGASEERARVVAECWAAGIEAENRWASRIAAACEEHDPAYVTAWSEANQVAGIHEALSRHE